MQLGPFSERGDDAALRRNVKNPCETDFFLRKNSPTQDLPLPPDLFLAESLSLSLSLSLLIVAFGHDLRAIVCVTPYSNRRVPVDEALGQISSAIGSAFEKP